MKDKSANIVRNKDGKNIVLLNDIVFRSRRTIDWDKVEEYLKEYIGSCYKILETSEEVYIGADFPDEFCHSKDIMKRQKRTWYR